jgi:hypothetical protein
MPRMSPAVARAVAVLLIARAAIVVQPCRCLQRCNVSIPRGSASHGALAGPPGAALPSLPSASCRARAALGIFASAALFSGRAADLQRGGGPHSRDCRMGIPASLAAIIQHAKQELLYGLWKPRDAGRSMGHS